MIGIGLSLWNAALAGAGVIVTQTIMRDSRVMRDNQRMTDNG